MLLAVLDTFSAYLRVEEAIEKLARLLLPKHQLLVRSSLVRGVAGFFQRESSVDDASRHFGEDVLVLLVQGCSYCVGAELLVQLLHGGVEVGAKGRRGDEVGLVGHVILLFTG